MNSFHLKIDYEAATSIVVSLLTDNLNTLKDDWAKVYAAEKGFVFSMDREEDLEQISEHISALKKVLRYYGERI